MANQKFIMNLLNKQIAYIYEQYFCESNKSKNAIPFTMY